MRAPRPNNTETCKHNRGFELNLLPRVAYLQISTLSSLHVRKTLHKIFTIFSKALYLGCICTILLFNKFYVQSFFAIGPKLGFHKARAMLRPYGYAINNPGFPQSNRHSLVIS